MSSPVEQCGTLENMRSILQVPAACNPIYRYHIEFAERTEENGRKEYCWVHFRRLLSLCNKPVLKLSLVLIDEQLILVWMEDGSLKK